MANQAILTAKSIVDGVELVSLASLPAIWEQIAKGEVQVGHTDPEFLINLARLFFTKETDGSQEIFTDLHEQKELNVFRAFYKRKAYETLEFYGDDFLVSAYTHDWNRELTNASAPYAEAEKVIAFVKDVFSEFGYNFPASFYWMLMCPINRSSIYKAIPLAFDPQSQGVKSIYDSALHALNVSEVMMVVQSYASRYGFRLQHGCGCDHSLARLLASDKLIDVSFSGAIGKKKAETAYVWRMFIEKSLFKFQTHAPTLAL